MQSASDRPAPPGGIVGTRLRLRSRLIATATSASHRKTGPRPGKGINEAVGPKPTNLLQLRPWRKVHDEVGRYLAQTVDREPAIEHTL